MGRRVTNRHRPDRRLIINTPRRWRCHRQAKGDKKRHDQSSLPLRSFPALDWKYLFRRSSCARSPFRLLVFQICQIGLAIAAAHDIDVKGHVAGGLVGQDSQKKAAQFLPRGATQPVPPPDLAEGTHARIALRYHFRQSSGPATDRREGLVRCGPSPQRAGPRRGRLQGRWGEKGTS